MKLKDALTYEQQVDHLKNIHKLVIPSEKEAVSILSRVNYYRLSAYGIGLKKQKITKSTLMEYLL